MKTFIATALILSGLFGFTPENDNSHIVGVWTRTSDQLRIEIKEESSDILSSFIIAEGNHEFPCDVSALPIYKKINKVGKNLWRCEFIVVTIKTCSTDYEEGIIQLINNDRLEITCPGFDKRIYTRSKPRYEGD